VSLPYPDCGPFCFMKRAYEPEVTPIADWNSPTFNHAAVDEVVDLAASLVAIVGNILETWVIITDLFSVVDL